MVFLLNQRPRTSSTKEIRRETCVKLLDCLWLWKSFDLKFDFWLEFRDFGSQPVGWRSEFAFPLCNYSIIPAISTQQCANRCFLTVRSLSHGSSSAFRLQLFAFATIAIGNLHGVGVCNCFRMQNRSLHHRPQISSQLNLSGSISSCGAANRRLNRFLIHFRLWEQLKAFRFVLDLEGSRYRWSSGIFHRHKLKMPVAVRIRSGQTRSASNLDTSGNAVIDDNCCGASELRPIAKGIKCTK
jgi:hypothetical protein